MTTFELTAIHGGLTQTSKMPCPGFAIPAHACPTGSKLASVEGTICASCYGERYRFAWRNIQAGMQRRLELLQYWIDNDPRTWVEAMTESINPHRYFRWHVVGDVQNETHLEMITDIANALPKTDFWLPTAEVWVAQADMPDNITVRLSATKIDGPPSRVAAYTSTVSTTGHTCPAPQQNNECGTCRACWSRDVKNVAYAYH